MVSDSSDRDMELREAVSLLEAKFTVAMIKSRNDGDPKHRQQVIDDFMRLIKRDREAAVTKASAATMQQFKQYWEYEYDGDNAFEAIELFITTLTNHTKGDRDAR